MEYNSFLRCTGYTITLTGTPNFSVAFADADLNAGMNIGGNTFTGSGTGKRYEVTLNSSMNVSGAGATYLPGNVSGTTATGGEYA